jgi:hypothetical protein
MFEPGKLYRCRDRFFDAKRRTWTNFKFPMLCIETKKRSENVDVCLFLIGETVVTVDIEERELHTWEECEESNV